MMYAARRILGLSVRAAAASFALAFTAAAPAPALIPRDPGRWEEPGGWQHDQWNFLPGVGVDAPRAWDNLIAVGRPGGHGVTVAVLDTGLAYEDRLPFARSPDVSRFRLARGRDFCSLGRVEQPCVGSDNHPNDETGHGTHVAGTLAEATNNAIGETGLAYEATIMPVKILNMSGRGDPRALALGIRYAARHGAQIINVSSSFPKVPSALIPELGAAVRTAQRGGALIVAAAGNDGSLGVNYPAALRGVVAVGATTAHGCRAAYSNYGKRVDLVAPGGGRDASLPAQSGCQPNDRGWRHILQMTFNPSHLFTFGIPTSYEGTSMAVPHVSATAALVIASGVLGSRPSPAKLKQRLLATARDLGPPGPDKYYGAGIVDAGAATAP
jgi:serine protease